VSGIPGIFLALLFLFTATEPARTLNEDQELVTKAHGNEMTRGNFNSIEDNCKVKYESNCETDGVGHNGNVDEKQSNEALGDSDTTSSLGDGSKLTIIHQGKGDVHGQNDSQWDIFMKGIKIGWNILRNPAMVFLLLGACVRHAGRIKWKLQSVTI
jgi:hypothetical protein